MITDTQFTYEIFALALYQKLTPQEKGALFTYTFPDLSVPFLEWANNVQLSSQKIAKYREFKKKCDIKGKLNELEKAGVGWLTIFDPGYPQALRHMYAAPLVIFYKGNLTLLHYHCIGFVGARACTNYGIKAVQRLIPPLVEEGYPIVSGLARGLDTEAHKATLEAGGHTIAVIGTGFDSHYPPENRSLQEELSKNHLVLSEYPLGVGPKKHHFPFRNRIVAGLSQGVVVVEAKERSGSLITARQALDNGREVFAVPGSIFSPYSQGCNKLIQGGAKAVVSAEEIMEEFGY